MPKFRVGVWEEVGGYACIKARGKNEARAKAQQILDDEGIGGFRSFDPTHRNPTVLDVEEIKKEKKNGKLR